MVIQISALEGFLQSLLSMEGKKKLHHKLTYPKTELNTQESLFILLSQMYMPLKLRLPLPPTTSQTVMKS